MKNTKKNGMKNHKTQVMEIIIIILFLISMFVSYKMLWVKKMSDPWAAVTVENADNYLGDKMYVDLQNEDQITQRIQMISDNFSGFALKFVNVSKKIEGDVQVGLYDSQNELIQNWRLDCESITQEGYYNFMLPEAQKVQLGENYLIKINPTITAGIAPALEMSNASAITGTANVSGEELTSSLAYKLYDGDQHSLKYFFIAIIIAGIACVIVLNFTMKRDQIANSFVAMILLIGSVYIFVIPPFSVPDEYSHIVTAYSKSSELLGREVVDENGQAIGGLDMGICFVREEYPTAASYVRYMKGALGKNENVINSKISLREPLSSETIGYIPQIIGISLGRIIGANGEQVLLLGRLFALLWYCIMMYCAIRLMPVKKMSLFVIGLLPMTIQQAVSFSYDSVLLGFCFLLIAYLFKLIFDKEKVEIKDLCIIIALSIGIGLIKYVYLPILALMFLIPKEKFTKKLNKRKVLGSGMMMLLSIFAVSQFAYVVQAAEETGTLRPDGLYQYTIPYIFHNLGSSMIVVIRTILENSSFYVESMIASPMGWVDIQLSGIIIWGFVILLLLSSLFDTKQFFLPSKVIVYCVLITCVVGGGVLIALMIGYTYIGSDVIIGVQGRYFLPVLPLVICLVQSKKILIKQSIDKEIILLTLALQLYTIWSITVSVISR